MNVPPETQTANRRLLLGLIVFSIALALAVYLWMRIQVRARGGVVDPQQPHAVEWRPTHDPGFSDRA